MNTIAQTQKRVRFTFAVVVAILVASPAQAVVGVDGWIVPNGPPGGNSCAPDYFFSQTCPLYVPYLYWHKILFQGEQDPELAVNVTTSIKKSYQSTYVVSDVDFIEHGSWSGAVSGYVTVGGSGTGEWLTPIGYGVDLNVKVVSECLLKIDSDTWNGIAHTVRQMFVTGLIIAECVEEM